ncbi:MAG TPA: DUF4340 domain-containing protein [Steroidobacteraceae bacterium]|nr:DUF4340 domain-containing protein [Steroidobacteraceae bacterium]
MMTPRRLTVLAAVSIAVLGLALWVTQRRASEGSTSADDEPLAIPGLRAALNSVTEVRIAKGDGTRATLKKGATDWTVGERDFPADSSLVRKFLIDLSNLQVVEQKTSDPASYAELGVEDVTSPKSSGTLVELVEPAKTIGLIIGKPSGMNSSFVRLAGEKQSLLVTPQLIPESDPRRWLRTAVIDLPESRVREVLVHPASGPEYTVVRASAQQLNFTVPRLPKGRELMDPGAADPVASALAGLTLDDVRSAAAVTTPGPEHATFRTFDGLTLEVTGIKDGDRRFLALHAQSDSKATQSEAERIDAQWGGRQVEVLGYKYDSLFRPLDQLLKAPPVPAKSKAAKHAAHRTLNLGTPGTHASP